MTPKPEIITSLELWQRLCFHAKFGIFDAVELDRRLAKWLRQRPTARNCEIGEQNVHIAISRFQLSFVVAIAGGQFRRTGSGRKPQICRWNCYPVCHSSRDISISGFGGHIAISGYLSMSHLFGDTLFDFGVVENFVYSSRIAAILTSDLYSCMSLWLWLCSRWRPITTSGFVRHLENVQIRLFTLLPNHLTIFSLWHSKSITFVKFMS